MLQVFKKSTSTFKIKFMTHTVVQLKNGEFTLKNTSHGEIMHSTIGPSIEAQTLYIDQSGLSERLKQKKTTCIYDLGLGAGSNALAAFQCALKNRGEITIYSFENEIGGFESAVNEYDKFPFFTDLLDFSKKLLSHKEAYLEKNGAKLTWKLYLGDFNETYNKTEKTADLIFFDFYSPKVTSNLWTPEVFLKCKSFCNENTELYTYSASTAVRVALLLAGFYVGHGFSTGAKAETTVAAITKKNLEKPLDLHFIEKLKRSSNPFPHTDGSGEKYYELDSIIERIRPLLE
jgi:queuine tRNA-ribosyltransferase